MDSSDYHFKVKIDSGIIKVIVVIVSFFIIFAVIRSIVMQSIDFTMVTMFLLFIIVPSILVILYIERTAIKVNNDMITTRGMFSNKYTFNVSDIEGVRWVQNDSGLVHTEIMTIYAPTVKVTVDSNMSGFENMADYIRCNVDHRLINEVKR